MFYETTGKELTLPENFAQFDELAAFFSRQHQPDNRLRPMGTAVTLGSSGLIATEYLYCVLRARRTSGSRRRTSSTGDFACRYGA
jgi:hypothetical protein